MSVRVQEAIAILNTYRTSGLNTLLKSLLKKSTGRASRICAGGDRERKRNHK